MAGDLDKMKEVFFIGAWRTQHVSDKLLLQISNQISLKKKVLTKLNISSEGLELFIFNSEGKVIRKDKIAIENIVDFIDNKHNTTCTLAIVREKQQKLYTVFVFLCKSDRDAAAIIHTFKATKNKLSGEGYNTNLTPKGTNWTLQQKEEKLVHKTLNGDVRGQTIIQVPSNNVRAINTEQQNGSVTVINTDDRHDSFSRASVRTSNSEVKEELHQLADEVRDIKLMLQGSTGRTQFEKHYGYRIRQESVPEDRRVEYTERNIIARPVEPMPGQVYVKNEANTRYITNVPQVVRTGRGIARSTRRNKSNAHFVTAMSPTRGDYTKRIYDSRNPYVEKFQPPVKVITRSNRSVVIPRHRIYPSSSSDIVHKNIEDVYKSRSLRRMYHAPSSINGKTVEYVNSQSVQLGQQEHPPLSTKPSSTKDSDQTSVHVKYSPEIRTYFEPKDSEIVAAETSASHVNTHIYSTVNDNLVDESRQVERNIDIEERESEYKTDGNVIIVNAIQEPQDYSENIDDNVVYIQNRDENTSRSNVSNTIGGGVYHVRAEFAEDYENPMSNDEHVTVIGSTEARQDDVRIIKPYYDQDNIETIDNDENVTVIRSSFVTHDLDNVKNTQTAETVEVIESTEAKQDDVRIINSDYDQDNIETIANDEHVTVIRSSVVTHDLDNAEVTQNVENVEYENVGLFGAYVKKPEDYDEAQDEVTTETAYRYHDDEQNVELIHKEDNVEVKATEHNGDEENVGLFGAYTKTPDEHDEPRDEILTEAAYRYHDHGDESVIVEDSSEQLQSMKEDGGLFGTYANKLEDPDELKTEIIRETTNTYHANGIDELEKNAETMFEEGKQEVLEEKRVRYNEMVEQIPLVDDEPMHDADNFHHTRDVFEVDKHEGLASQDDFKHELGAVVARLRHNYDEKVKEVGQTDIEKIETEDKYEFDMDALKAYSMEPNIIILDADEDKKVNNVSSFSNQSVPEAFKFDKEEVLDKVDDHVGISNLATSAEIQTVSEKSVVIKEKVHEIISATEDSVLF